MPNYIQQLNLFHRWLETHYLPANAQLLWFHLIGLFNASGWECSVQVSTARLMSLLNTRSNNTVLQARNALVEAGLLEFEAGKNGLPCRYKLLDFRADGTVCDTDTEYHSAHRSAHQTENHSAHQTAHINKYKKKQDEDEKNIISDRVPQALQNAWSAYTQMRAQIGKGVTDAAAQMLLERLEEMAPHDYAQQARILDRSTMHGWQGLFPLPDADEMPPRSYDIEQMERRLWETPVPIPPPDRLDAG